MNKITISLLAIFLISISTEAKDLPEVMLMGAFHFNNPGMDIVKTEQINVMEPKNQKYLQKLTKKISKFKPNMVLLEFDPKNTDIMNQKYQDYLNGEFKLPSNEVYQIGFRVAKLSGVKRIESLDVRGIPWEAEELYEYLAKNDKKTQMAKQGIIEELTKKTSLEHKTLSLRQLLKNNNNTTEDNNNKNLYLFTNFVGVKEGHYFGANATASWWHRNFAIYAKIQYFSKTHDKIFALAGQGHTAILKDFLKTDNQIKRIKLRL